MPDDLKTDRTGVDEAVVAELQLAVSRALEKGVEDPASAIAQLKHLLETVPGDETVLRAIVNIERKLGERVELAEAMRVLAGAVKDLGEKRVLLHEAAQIYREFGRFGEEVTTFIRLLEIDGSDTDVIKSLEDACERNGDWDTLSDLLEKDAQESQKPEERAFAFMKLAALWLNRMNSPEISVDFVEKALVENPEVKGAAEALELLAKSPASAAKASELLEKYCRGREYWEEVVGKLEAESKETPDRTRSKEKLLEAAAVHSDKLGQPDMALLILIKLFRTNFNDPEIIDRLWKLGEKNGQLEEISEVFQEALATGGTGTDAKLEIARRLSSSESLWDPRSVPTLLAMEALFRADGEWEKLADVLKRHIPLESDRGTARRMWIDLAETQGLRLGNKEEAMEAARRLLDLEDRTVEELDRMAVVLESLGAWEDLAHALVIKADLIDDPTRKALNLLRAAGLYRREIGNDLPAMGLYEKVLSIDPGSMEAFHALTDLYTVQGDWHKLINLTDNLLSSTSDRGRRVELLGTVAEIYKDKLNQPHMAFISWCRIWREDFSDISVLGTVEVLAAETGAWEELYFLCQEAIETVTDPAVLAEIRKRAAKLASERLDMADEAEGHLKEILAADSSNVQALDSMAAFLESRERWADLVDILRKKAVRLEEPERKIELWIRIGGLLDAKLGDKEGASAAYKAAFGLDPADARPYEALCALLKRDGRWEDIVGVYIERAGVTQDPTEAETIRLTAAALIKKELADPRRAAGVYRDVLSGNPGCLPALAALDEIYVLLDEPKDLLDIIEKRIDVGGDGVETAELHSRAAAICADRLGDPVRAARHYEDLLATRPDDSAALEALERIYEGMGAWEKFVETCRRHVEATEDGARKVGLLSRMAEVYADKLSQQSQSAETYMAVLEIDGSNLDAVRRLAEFHLSDGNWSGALEMLEREAKLLGKGAEAVAVWHRMGKIHGGTLLDPDSAAGCYLKALETDPAHLDSIRALKAIYAAEKNHAEYLKMVLEEAKYVEDVPGKTALYFEAGGLYDMDKNDPSRAAECYEEALRLSPDHIPAARVLSDIYFKREDWQRAGACVEVVVKGLDRELAGKELARHYYRLGYVNEKLKEYEKAFEAYTRSVELEAGRMPALEGIATTLMKLERWEEAARAYRKMVTEYGDSLSEAEVAEMEFQIGELFRTVGETDEAIAAFERVVRADDRHIKALYALMELKESKGEFEEAFDLMLQLAALHEGRERFDLYMRMGALCRERLEDPYRAIDAFLGATRAMDDEPAQLPAMEELYKLYRTTSQFAKSAETLEKIVGIETDGGKLARYYFDLAEILKGEATETDRAIDAYNKVLDFDPAAAKAFAAIEGLLAEKKEWRKLEENYRAMIQRTPKEAKGKRLVLWRNLGELYRRVLRDVDAAVMAYEVVHGYDKENLDTLEILADLYSSKEKYREKALKAHHTVLRLTANPAKSCKALKKFYLAAREFDKVYVVSSVLKYLGQAEEEDEKILSQLAPRLRETVSRPLTEEAWETCVLHPKAKGAVASAMAYLRRHMGSTFVQSVESFGVRKKDMVDVDKSQLYFVNMFKYSVKALGTGDFLLYRAPAGVTGLKMVLSNPNSLLAGEDMFKERPKKEIWFRLAREMTLARHEFAVAAMLPAGELFALWNAVLSLVSAEHAQQATTEPILRWRNVLLKNLTQDNLTALRALLSGYLREGGGSGIEGWLEAVEYTCLRCGLVMSGDLSTCMSVVQENPGRLARPAFRSMVREAVMYAVSEEYLALREKLGLSVQTG